MTIKEFLAGLQAMTAAFNDISVDDAARIRNTGRSL